MLLSLAFVFVAGSFTTIRRRRLASPTSIPEIEATHPHVNPLRRPVCRRCVSGRPMKRPSFYGLADDRGAGDGSGQIAVDSVPRFAARPFEECLGSRTAAGNRSGGRGGEAGMVLEPRAAPATPV